jgi:ABC-type multidrug transport system fused ATPase/permease subunit
VALFRLPKLGLNQGRILIDNVDISTVGIHTLRSNMMIIPQVIKKINTHIHFLV